MKSGKWNKLELGNFPENGERVMFAMKFQDGFGNIILGTFEHLSGSRFDLVADDCFYVTHETREPIYWQSLPALPEVSE